MSFTAGPHSTTRAIGVSRAACKHEFPHNPRSHDCIWCIFHAPTTICRTTFVLASLLPEGNFKLSSTCSFPLITLLRVANFFRGYSFKAGSYIYVNSPTIARSEWHPFSIIQVPGKANRAAFYVEAVSGKS